MDAKEKAEQREQDIRTVMATVEGRRLLWGIIDGTAGVFSPSYSVDPHATAFNEGRRSVGIELMVALQAVAAANYMRALHEALGEREMERETKQKRPRED